MTLSRGKMLRYAAIGSEFFSPIIVGPIVGHYLDLYFRTDPWLTFVMFLLGVMAGFYNLIREVRRFQKELSE
jgi:ATP synthase protein I